MKSNKLSFLNSLIYGSFWVICTPIFSIILLRLPFIYYFRTFFFGTFFTTILVFFAQLASGVLITKIIFYMIPKKFEKKDKKPPFKKDILLSLANFVIVQTVSFVTGFIVMILAEFYSSEIFSLVTDVDVDIKHNLPEFALLSLITSILSIPFISLSIRFYINKYVLK